MASHHEEVVKDRVAGETKHGEGTVPYCRYINPDMPGKEEYTGNLNK